MYTDNTMAPAPRALGMSLPGSAPSVAIDRRRDEFARKSGEAVVEMLRRGITARDILSKEAFENALAFVMAVEPTPLGGSRAWLRRTRAQSRNKPPGRLRPARS